MGQVRTSTTLGLISTAALLLSCVTHTVMASPLAMPEGSRSVQPGVGEIVVVLKGDADHAWYESEDGYLVTKDAAGRWVYANVVTSAKSLSAVEQTVPTAWVVGADDPASVGLQPYERIHHHAHHDNHKAVSGGNAIGSKLGEVPMLVIMGYYDDALAASNCSACATTNVDYVQQLFFADGTQQNSVADFFSTASKGAFTMTQALESHGTVDDGVVGWLRLGAMTPDGAAMNTSAYKSNRIAADAMTAAMDYVDFTQYDANNDGRITTDELGITIILAGYEASYGRDASGKTLADDTNSPRIWGQSRTFVKSASGVDIPQQTLNNKTVSINTTSNGMTYSIVGELHGNHPLTMGIVTHELGHTLLDLPDLYDTKGSSNGVGAWSLMGFGSWGRTRSDFYPGETPVMMDAWSRVAMGWANPMPVSNGEFMNVNAQDLAVYKIDTANAQEYFLVENRQNEGYDAGLYYFLYTTNFGGLALWHIDDAVGRQNMNDDNSNVHRKRVDLVAAEFDDLIDAGSSYGRAANLFNAEGISNITAQTHNDMLLYSGADSGIEISDISYASPAMSFVAYVDNSTSNQIGSTTLNNSMTANPTPSNSASSGGGGAVYALLLLLVWRRFSAGQRKL